MQTYIKKLYFNLHFIYSWETTAAKSVNKFNSVRVMITHDAYLCTRTLRALCRSLSPRRRVQTLSTALYIRTVDEEMRSNQRRGCLQVDAATFHLNNQEFSPSGN